MIMKVTPAFINSHLNWIQKDYHQLFSEGCHASQQGFTVYRKNLLQVIFELLNTTAPLQ